MFKYFLFLILGIGFLVRILGINYGLPLWLVSDEQPSIFVALKMIEIKTLIPALHNEVFRKVLYFPPYLPYSYLIPFVSVSAVKYLFFNGGLVEFKNFLIADPSIFYIIARLFSVILGTFTVWLVYKAGRNLFKSESVALFSAAFLAFSYMHANFSHWARHWIPAAFILALIIYILSRDNLPAPKKYLIASTVAGIGAGINNQIALSVVFIVFWFVFYEKLFSFKIFREKWVYFCIFLFVSLFLLASYVLYPGGMVVGGKDIMGVGIERSFGGFLHGYVFYFLVMLYNDPVLLLFTLIGLFFCFFRNRRYFIAASGFIFVYIAIFYFMYFHVDRYILMLFPIFALTAGYGFSILREKFPKNFRFLITGFGLVSLTFLIIVIARFDFILLKNDTRIQAIKWFESSVLANCKDCKTAVLVPLMRIPATPAAIEEQARIEPTSLRQAEMAEMNLKNGSGYYVLNLYNVKSPQFFKNLFGYLESNNYKYLIFSDNFVRGNNVSINTGTMKIIKIFDGYYDESGDVADWFSGGDSNSRRAIQYFTGGIMRLFSMENNGPRIVIGELQK